MQLAQNICETESVQRTGQHGPTRQSCGRASDFHAVRKISRQCVTRASETCLRKLAIFLYFQFNLCERINVCENSFTEMLILFTLPFLPFFLFASSFLSFFFFFVFFSFFSFNFYFNSFFSFLFLSIFFFLTFLLLFF